MSSFDELRQQERQSSQTSTTRASDVRGGYSNPRPAGDTSGQGRSPDYGSAGGQAQGTPRKTYKARSKYTEYLDNKQNLQRLARNGTITRGLTSDTISFSRNEDRLAYQAESANVFAFENDNTMCDGGNSLACQRSGRGSAPTEYASPFKESPHFNDVAYFGGGGREMTRQMRTESAPEAEPAVDPRYARTGTYAYEGESNAARANRLIREAQEVEADVEADGEVTPVPPEVDSDIVPSTGGSSGGQPQHNPAGAGAGSHSGADGSGTHEPPGVVSFDSGGVGVAQPNPTRVYLNNLAGLVDPYSINKRQCKNDPKHMQF